MPFKVAAQSTKEGVTLLIWVEDSPREMAFTRSNFQAHVAFLNRLNIPKVRTAYFYYDNNISYDYDKVLDAALAPNDKISKIIVATHGSTFANKTQLQRMGGFQSHGAYGPFESILEKLGPKLSNELHIYLDSCSTFCGSEKNVTARVEGVYNQLQKYNVTKLTMWGAQEILRASRRAVHIPSSMVAKTKHMIPELSRVAVGAFLFGYVSSVGAGSGEMLLEGSNLAIIAVTLYAGYEYTKYYKLITSKGRGLLVSVQGDETKIERALRDSPRSLQHDFNGKTCRQFFL